MVPKTIYNIPYQPFLKNWLSDQFKKDNCTSLAYLIGLNTEKPISLYFQKNSGSYRVEKNNKVLTSGNLAECVNYLYKSEFIDDEYNSYIMDDKRK